MDEKIEIRVANEIQAFRDLIKDLGYDWLLITAKDKQDIAERLSGMVGKVPAWSGVYVYNVYMGMQPSKLFLRAMAALGNSFDGVPAELAAAYAVRAFSVNQVHDGVLILAQERRCEYPPCPIWFIPRSGNQKCHSKECSIKLRKLKKSQGEKANGNREGIHSTNERKDQTVNR